MKEQELVSSLCRLCIVDSASGVLLFEKNWKDVSLGEKNDNNFNEKAINLIRGLKKNRFISF